MVRKILGSPAAAAAGLASSLMAALSAAQPLHVPAGLTGAPPVGRQFQDWLLVCDNLQVCRAQPRSYSGLLMVRRDPGPEGKLTVILDGQDPTPGSSVPNVNSIAIHGARPDPSLAWRHDPDLEAAVLEDEPALRFVRSIADASVLTYRAGEETLEVSLSGLKAALLAMDDVQGRVDTPTAFTRIGRRLLSQVPAAIDMPVVHAAPAPTRPFLAAGFAALVRRASTRWLAEEECPTERIEADSAYPLTSSEAIVMLACGTGTHSTGYVIVRASRDARPHVRRVVLPSVPRREGEADHVEEVYSDVEWDPATASLYSSGYACAHSCGESSRWVFDGRDFVLAEHFIYEAGGAELLYLYRTEVRVRR